LRLPNQHLPPGAFLDQIPHYSDVGLPASAVTLKLLPTKLPVSAGGTQAPYGLVVLTAEELPPGSRFVMDWEALAPPNPIPPETLWIRLTTER
jgi:hypothetical protein